MTEDICAECRFWKELKPGPDGPEQHGYTVSTTGTGLCRRYPPHGNALAFERIDVVVDSVDAASAAAWPVTRHNDQCGEHVTLVWQH